MDKMGYEPGLIRYTTEHALEQKLDSKAMWHRVFRMRTLVYGGVLGVIILAAALSLAYHMPLKVDVLRDRGMPKITETGAIENVYRLQIMNTQEVGRTFKVSVKGIAGAEIVNATVVSVNSASAVAFPVRVRIPAGSAEIGSTRISFVVEDINAPEVAVNEKAAFLVPR
jgi:polyferredoxin